MKSFVRIILYCLACFFCIYIFSTAYREKLYVPLFGISASPTPNQLFFTSKNSISDLSINQQSYPNYCITVPVILYHHIENLEKAAQEGHAQLTVDTDNFDQHMQYLVTHGYHAISAEQLVEALKKRLPLPTNSVVITLDDGYEDNYENAYPIAEKYKLILNFMIPTALIEKPGYMHWFEIQEMQKSGLVHFYNHTQSHVSLPAYSKEVIASEILNAQQQLEEHGISAPKILIYPYGTYNNTVIDILKKNNYIGAFSTETGSLECDSFIFSLHRIHVGNMDLSQYGF